jgi:transcriptional regulator GlxA family with amidase domain
MAARLADPLPVPDLAAALGVSADARTAVRDVRRASPATELRRLRVDLACRLLAETDQPVRDVAVACGFSAVELLQRAMQKRVGMTPSEYRAQRQAKG